MAIRWSLWGAGNKCRHDQPDATLVVHSHCPRCWSWHLPHLDIFFSLFEKKENSKCFFHAHKNCFLESSQYVHFVWIFVQMGTADNRYFRCQDSLRSTLNGWIRQVSTPVEELFDEKQMTLLSFILKFLILSILLHGERMALREHFSPWEMTSTRSCRAPDDCDVHVVWNR